MLQQVCYAQNKSDQGIELQQADSLIEAGYDRQASIILDKIREKPQKEIYLLQSHILSARILHENGDRVKAIKNLKSILALPALNTSQNIRIRVDTYLILAECYWGMAEMEDFKHISDTILRLATLNNLNPFYRARAYTNIVRYYGYNIIPNTGKLYLDSAFALYNSAPEKEKKFYNPVALYTADIDLNRDLDRGKLGQTINTVLKLIHGNYNREKYNQTMLWRVIGGVFLDILGDKPQNNETPYTRYRTATRAYQRAATILKTDYPSNQVDQISADNLLGLLNYNFKSFKSAENYFNLSKAILAKNQLPIDQYPLAYSKTYLWEALVKDSVYSGKLLIKKRREELSEWMQLAPHWQKWMQINQNKSMHYFRDNYTRSPFDNIVRLCYQLYQTEKNPKYIDWAFKAQENGKNFFLKDEYKKRYHIAEPSLPDIQSIQHHISTKEAIISFSDLGNYYKNLYAIVITSDTVSIKKFDFTHLHRFIDERALSGSTCKDLSNFKRYYYEAYQTVFKPIKSLLSSTINDLLIFPSTLSSYFKFDLMVSDTSGINSFGNLPYLNFNYRIQYDFSYQFQRIRDRLVKQQKKNTSANLQAYIPYYAGTKFYSLPFFTKLGDSLKSIYDFNVFNNSGSNIPNYKLNSGRARILQFVGHSLTDEFAAEDLKIAMDSTKQGDSRFLTMEDIVNSKLQADLTVLTLCETGEGDTRIQDSYLNMAYWFTYAGSKSCLFSYWKLDDRSTSFILERFYHYLSLGMKKSDALKSAQKDYLLQAKSEEEKNPIYWGSLTLIGDDSPVKLDKNKPLKYWYLAVLLFIQLLVLIKKRAKEQNADYQRFGSVNK